MSHTSPKSDNDDRTPLVGCSLEPELIVLERVRHQHLALLTERETALVLGKNEAALAKMRKGGHGPDFVEVGRSIYYRFDALRDWLAQIERPAGAFRAGEVA